MARFTVLVGLSFYNPAGEEIEGETSVRLHIEAASQQEAENIADDAVWVTTNARPFTGPASEWQGNNEEEDDDGE